jgi:DNA-binding NarL/FixJ family response regulator
MAYIVGVTELSTRQADVLERVGRGLPDKVIAHELGISVHTVRDHIDRIASLLPGNTTPRHRLLLFFLTDPDGHGPVVFAEAKKDCTHSIAKCR